MSTAKPTFLGLDLGGTKLLIGEMSEGGEVLRTKRYNTGYLDQGQATKLICEALDDYMDTVGWVGEKPVSMGLGVVGQVDYKNGVWLLIDKARQNAVPIAALLTERYGIPCAADNDVKAATAAECRFGAGRECKDLIYMNVGTGIAAGFVVDGRLLRGASDDSGEIGHMVVDIDSDAVCSCSLRGCVEAIASGIGFSMRAQTWIDRYKDSPLKASVDNGEITSREIFRLSDMGDPLSMKLAYEAADALAVTIMNLVRVTDPEIVILGGGVVADGWLLPKIKRRLVSDSMKNVKKGVALSQIDPGMIGLVGAATVGIDRYFKL